MALVRYKFEMDGSIYEVEAPEGMSPEQLGSAIKQQEASRAEQLAAKTAADLAKIDQEF